VSLPEIDELHFEGAPAVDSPPGPESQRLLDRQDALESNAALYPDDIPIAFEEGRGATLRDVDGNTYLDFFAGIGVLNVGHANPYVTEAATEQLERLPHSLDFPTEPRLDLIETLDEIAPPGLRGNMRVNFGGPTGSDAVEATIKLAKHNTGNDGLVAFYGSFHGETSGAFSLSADTKYKKSYTPLLAEVEHVPYPYPFRQGISEEQAVDRALEGLKTVLGDRYGAMANPAGVWVEPIQGEGGTVVPPDGFLQGVRDLCDDHDVPLIIDEIQTGMGRTGEWWACEHYDVTPDIMPMAKALGSGLPLSGTMYREKLDTWDSGGHTGTFRGFNPAMRASVRSIEYIRRRDLLTHAREIGNRILGRLRSLAESNPHVGDVRGKGLFIGAELVDENGDPAPQLLESVRTTCYRNGLLVWAGGRDDNVLRLLPPLVLTREQADIGPDILTDAVEHATD
jgi:diaminobutyrate-2-oxoglutarate transaminase